MNEQRFTPGPWHRDKYGHIVDGEGSDVLFRSVSILGSGAPERMALAEANTDVAAAAPDLLANLERMVQWYARRDEDSDDMLHIDEQPAEVRQAMFAIARALPQGAPE
jgi:hypothetical protein